jgi:hypothetical protein
MVRSLGADEGTICCSIRSVSIRCDRSAGPRVKRNIGACGRRRRPALGAAVTDSRREAQVHIP